MRPKIDMRALATLAGAGALSLTLIAAARAPASAAPAVSIADRSLQYGESLVVSGRLTADSPGRGLVLEFRPRGGAWGPVASATAGADGRFRFRTPAQRSGDVRVSFAPEAGATRAAGQPAPPSAASPEQAVSVAATFAGRFGDVDVSAGRVAVLRGALAPGIPGRRVTLERPGRRMLARARTDARGRFVLRYRTRGAGSTALRLRFRGDAGNAGAWRRAGVLNAYRQSFASWYEDGGATACGFHARYGVAHRTLPCGTRVTIRYGGRRVVATVDDRGPYVGGRDWDLGSGTAGALGFDGTGAVWTTN